LRALTGVKVAKGGTGTSRSASGGDEVYWRQNAEVVFELDQVSRVDYRAFYYYETD